MKRFDVYAGYALALENQKPSTKPARTKMSRMNKDSNAYKAKEARVIQHKIKVGKLVMQDVQLFNRMSFVPSLYPFQLPISMMDAMLNTPSWQHEKTRLMSQLTLDAIALLHIPEDEVEINYETISQITEKKFQTLLKRIDVPELPPADLGDVQDLEISQVQENIIAPIATIDNTTSSYRDRIRASLFGNPTVLENSTIIEKYDAKKDNENRQYGWKPKLIRQLVAPYLECNELFSLKRAYPEEDLPIKFCQHHQFDEIFHMEYTDAPISPTHKAKFTEIVSKYNDRKIFCICTTLLYKAAFDRDYLIMAYQVEMMRRLCTHPIKDKDRPRTLITNYKWWRNEKIDQSTILSSNHKIFHLSSHGTKNTGHLRGRDSVDWSLELYWSE